MSGDARGGKFSDANSLYGDARSMYDNAVGGNDQLIGCHGHRPAGRRCAVHVGTARGGDDRLWGDSQGAVAGGADTFLFAGAIARDIIFDFRPDEGDLIELRGYGLHPFDDLAITTAGSITMIDIGASLDQTAKVHTIRLVGLDRYATGCRFRVHLGVEMRPLH